MNRLACLRITERCADILISVREEIAEAGDYVGEELRTPLAKLVECAHLCFGIHGAMLIWNTDRLSK
jgi:hypothetical protein